jgi:hypothetical protein
MRGRLRVPLGYFVRPNLSDAAFVCIKAATTSGSCCIGKKKRPRMVLFCCKIEDGYADIRLTGCRVRVYAPSTSVVCLPLALASASALPLRSRCGSYAQRRRTNRT